MNLASGQFLDFLMMAGCLFLSAFFSMAETAILSLGTIKTKHLIETTPEKRARHLKLWLDHPSRVLTTILIVNTLVNILASALATKVSLYYLESHAIAFATGLATFVILVFGEVIPKGFGKANHQILGQPCLRLIYALYRLIFPLVWILSEFARIIIRSFGSRDKPVGPTYTEEELEFLIHESESAGVIEDFKKDMITGVFDFDETKVREIMTPRTDIAAVDKNAPVNDVIKLTLTTGHSRIPVYDDTIDHVVGIIFAKDLLRVDAPDADPKSKEQEKLKISDVMRDAFFVPESKTIIEVFKDLKRTKNHMAIVIDEHGGTAGIVTMEDILEEIVGEIQDEFDVEEAKIIEIENNVYDVAGSVNVHEFCEFFDIDEAEVESVNPQADTVAGLVTHLLREIPKVGQKVEFADLEMEVSEVGRLRIERLRVTRVPETVIPPESESLAETT